MVGFIFTTGNQYKRVTLVSVLERMISGQWLQPVFVQSTFLPVGNGRIWGGKCKNMDSERCLM